MRSHGWYHGNSAARWLEFRVAPQTRAASHFPVRWPFQPWLASKSVSKSLVSSHQVTCYPSGLSNAARNCSGLFQKSCFFPQQRKLGVFSHSKGSGAGRSSQIRWEPGSGEGSGEDFPFTGESLGAARSARRKVGNRVPSKRFPSKVPRNRFPSNGS